MSEALQRGSVVLRGGHYGIVWCVRDGSLVLLPVTQARAKGRASHRRACDVDLTLAEMIAAGIALPAAFVQGADPIFTMVEDQRHVGDLVGAVLCRIVRAVIRASADAILDARWDAERRHRHEADTIGASRL